MNHTELESINPIMTRTAFCKHCEKARYPRKHTAYVTYGNSHGVYDLNLHVGEISKKSLGITPHVFFDTYIITPLTKDGRVCESVEYCVTSHLCGVIGCGFKIEWGDRGDEWWICTARKPDFTYIRGKNMEALENFKDEEMQLGKVHLQQWSLRDIVEEQQMIFESLR